MGSAKFTKESCEFKVFGDIWNLFRNNFVVEDTEVYWEKVIEEADEVTDKYVGTDAYELASIMVMSVLEYLDKKSKKEFPRYKRNEPRLDKLFRKVKFSYEEYLKDADEIDKLVLEEMLVKYPNKEECKLIMKVGTKSS